MRLQGVTKQREKKNYKTISQTNTHITKQESPNNLENIMNEPYIRLSISLLVPHNPAVSISSPPNYQLFWSNPPTLSILHINISSYQF